MDVKETTLEERAEQWNGRSPVRAYMAGYNDASIISFREPGREVMRIVHTADGFDIKIADGITMTEAAEKFINVVREMMEKKHGNTMDFSK